MKLKKLIQILIICIPALIGSFVGFLTADPIRNWYLKLNKPWFNPPNWVFAPVWTLLYLLMGFSCFLIFTSPANEHKRKAMIIFFIQLLLNFTWSLIFFNLQNPSWALGHMIILWSFINWTIVVFSKVNKTASYLLIPYVAWVSFAAILNLYIVLLN